MRRPNQAFQRQRKGFPKKIWMGFYGELPHAHAVSMLLTPYTRSGVLRFLRLHLLERIYSAAH
jgi:hypothetical protein